MFGLLAAEGSTSFWGSYGITIILVVLLVGFLVFSSIRRKKYDGQVQNFIDNLKIGDHVKTYSGFYGKIVAIRETTDGKVVLIEMGEGNKKGYIEADIMAIMGLDKKEDIVYDANGNIIEPKVEEVPVEDQKEEKHISTADKLREKKAKKEAEKEESTETKENEEEKTEESESK